MKNQIKKLALPGAFVLAFALALSIMHFVPTTAQPGDMTDPLVTRGYVNARITELSNEIVELRAMVSSLSPGWDADGTAMNQQDIDREMLFSDFIRYFEEIYGYALDMATSVIPFSPVHVPAGNMLLGHAGAEFILRSGIATAVSGPDGMVNVTSAVDVTSGMTIPANSLLLVPRTDGRGFVADTDVWVMIKGGFDIVPQFVY